MGHSAVSEPYERDADWNGQLKFWQNQLDRLADKKLSWEHFFSLMPAQPFGEADHPAFEAVTSRDGDSVLHIAVKQNEVAWAEHLAAIPILRIRRNSYGLTALELAAYLDRRAAVDCIRPRSRPSFSQQPNVDLSSPDAKGALDSIEFLSEPIFESEEIFYQILAKSKKAKLLDEIEPEKIWMGIYFDKEIQKGIHPKVTIRWIDDDVGYGVFAAQRIPSCAFVGEYTGVVQERRKKHLKDNYYCVQYNAWEIGRTKYVLDAALKGNFTRFINHSSRPNLGLQSVYWRGLPRMIFISLKEIPEGAQLTFDYGNFFWKECAQTPKNLS
jgi:hypothetical protein